MMKNNKKARALKTLRSLFLALLCCVTAFTAAVPDTAEAASKVTVQSKVRCGVGMRYTGYLNVQLVAKGDYIKNIKTSSNLVAKQTYHYDSDNPNVDLTLYAKKAGTYTLSFDVYKKGGKKRTHRSVKVYASGTGDVLKSVKINGKEAYSTTSYYSYYTSSSSLKVKFALSSGCKIKKIKVCTYDKNGNYKKSTFKNGKKVTLGKYGYTSEYNSDSYKSTSKGFFASTTFEITYSDSFTGTSDATVYYTIYKPATKWY